MSVGLEEIVAYSMFPVAGVVAAVVLHARGCLRRDVFDPVSPRQTGLTMLDLFIGIWILLGSSMLLGPAFRALGIPFQNPEATPTLLQSAMTPLVGQLVTQLPIVLFVVWRVCQVESGLRELGLVSRRPGREVLAGFLALLAAMPMVLGSSAICMIIGKLFEQQTPTVGHELLKVLLDSTDPLATALMVTSAVLVAPILEEIIFRGLVQSTLLSWLGPQSRWRVILIASVVFALIHGSVASWHVLPGLFILGLVLGWLYEKHGSLLPAIVLHMLFNLLNIGLGMMQTE